MSRELTASSIYPKSLLSRLITLTHEIAIPIAMSNRHVHLSMEDAGKLFGPSHELTLETPDKLLWLGQTLWKEKVTISGPVAASRM